MKFEVTILGSGGAIPKPERRCTAQVVNHHERFFLIDCSEGTQLRFRKFNLKMQRVEAIFISHLHGDHFLGLFSYLQTMSLLGRRAKLTLIANEKLLDILNLVQQAGGGNKFNFPLEFVPLQYEDKQIVYETKQLEVYSFPLKHRIPTCGFLFIEKPKPRKLIPEMLALYEVPYYARPSLKEGSDFVLPSGKVIPNSELTIPAEPSYSYAYCSDTAFNPDLVNFLVEPSVLYHESTFLKSDKDKAKKTFHSTTEQACEIAKLIKAKRLYAGHFSARYENVKLFQEELSEFSSNAYAAFDGQKIKLY
jgi:ribonuclease Z